MDGNKTRYIVVGGVLWAALIILVGGMLFLNEKDPRQKTASYYAMFDQVSSLGKGDPIRVNGVKVGKVADLGLSGRRVKVELSVVDTVKIPANSQVRVQNVGILGERQVGILLGDASEILRPGAVVEGSFDAGISEVLGAAGEVFDSVRVLLAVVRDVVDSTVGNDEFKASLNRIVARAEKLETRLDGMIGESEPLLKGSLQNLHKASVKVNELVDGNKAPAEKLLADAGALTSDARSLVAKADELTGRLDAMLAKLESRDNTVGILLNDDSFYRELSQTVTSADSLLRSVLKDGLDVNIDFF